MSEERLSFQHKSLRQQGYKDLTCSELRQLEWGLRFTPIVCSALTFGGLYFEDPRILLSVSVLGIWAFLAPGAHPMDLLYNRVVCRLLSSKPLPPNPFQRRLACLSAGVLNLVIALLFWSAYPFAAKVLGAVLIVMQLIVITTHFCALSWLYEVGLKALGSWESPLEMAKAEEHLRSGALLVDVREVHEFARDHLEGAVNFPLSSLDRDRGELKGKTCLLYCASGMRSRMATQHLKQAGITAYNLGGISRAKLLSRDPS